MGALPDTYTAYRSRRRRGRSRAPSRRRGASSVPREKGLTIPQMFDAAVAGDLKAMYIFGEDVAQTDPNTAHVVAALENLEFMVCQDIFETETTKYADVILPASLVPGEARHVHQRRAARSSSSTRRSSRPAARRPTSRSSRSVSRALGHEIGWDGPEDAMDEIAALTPHFAGVTYERLGRTGLQWPVAPDGTDAPILYENEFDTPDGRGPLRRAALQGARRRRQRGLPADPRHRPPPAALQRGHDDPPHRQPRAQRPRLPRDPPRRRRAPVDHRRRHDLGPLPSRAGPRSPPRSPTGSSAATSSPRSTSPRRARTC